MTVQTIGVFSRDISIRFTAMAWAIPRRELPPTVSCRVYQRWYSPFQWSRAGAD